MGNGPNGSPKVDPSIGAPQSDICHYYKRALLNAIAVHRATRQEEKHARRESRSISPERIEQLTVRYLAQTPFKSSSCRYHSFVVYFSNLQRLGWVEESGNEERSAFQDNYPKAYPRKLFRLTAKGRAASDTAWANPRMALYGSPRAH